MESRDPATLVGRLLALEPGTEAAEEKRARIEHLPSLVMTNVARQEAH